MCVFGSKVKHGWGSALPSRFSACRYPLLHARQVECIDWLVEKNQEFAYFCNITHTPVAQLEDCISIGFIPRNFITLSVMDRVWDRDQKSASSKLYKEIRVGTA